jgi:serine palmitoyltransferase
MAIATYLGYAVQIFCGHVRDVCARVFGRGRYVRTKQAFPSDNMKLYPPLLKNFDDFFTRRIYHRIQDCFNRVLASNPGAHIEILERVSSNGNKSLDLLGSLDNLENEEQKKAYLESQHIMTTSDGRTVRKCINLGSYNYLGFADDWETTCATEVLASLEHHPVSSSSCRSEFGTTVLHQELENVIADFLGKEDALVYNMGFNTNATTIPALVGRGDLLISDALNHTSIINGARASGAAIRVFRHNDTKHLEEIIREAIIFGRPRTRRAWNKIMVLVEGIYSMEGEYCDLPNVVRVCKKYGVYVYLDEAHSIGAMGPSGRGCAEYTGVDTADIDIMMGTFTKSFGGMGGYIASSKDVIAMLRQKCAGSAYHNSLSPVVCQQVITSLKVTTHFLLDLLSLFMSFSYH